MGESTTEQRVRREPPRFRRIFVRRKTEVTPRLLRVTFGGRELAGLVIDEPAASVRLLIPSPGSHELAMPAWNGNEFLLDDGSRPTIRTFTPRRFDPVTDELDLDIVIHEGGSTAAWALAAGEGAEAAMSGPGRGYTIDPDATRYVLAGDETAMPAICQLIEQIPSAIPVHAIIEIASQDARLDLGEHPQLDATWLEATPDNPPGTTMAAAVTALSFGSGTKLWAAGEAAAVHKIRRALLGDRVDRRDATIRGYWKNGS